MTELHDLLERAAGPHLAPTSADLDADIARGMRALRRRRAGVAGGALTAAVAAAALPVALGGGWSTGGAAQPGGPGTRTSAAPSGRALTAQEKKQQAAASLAADDATKRAALATALTAADRSWLVDGSAVPIHTYAGPELPGGFQPALMPAGTVVQGGSAYRLTIARADDPDTNPDSFAGKVVVMLSGRPAPETPEIQDADPLSRVVVVPLPQPIDGATAFEVQFAPGLHWTDDEAVKFASSITVLPTARAAKG